MEPYHIRGIAQELEEERGGKVSKGCEKHDKWGLGLKMHTKPWVRARYEKQLDASATIISSFLLFFSTTVKNG